MAAKHGARKKSCLPTLTFQFLDIIRALIVRGMFATHAIVTISLASIFSGHFQIWLLSIVLCGLFMEILVVIIRRRGKEWKCFSPSVFLYLCSTVPAIWHMELMLIYKGNHCKNQTNFSSINSSQQVTPLSAISETSHNAADIIKTICRQKNTVTPYSVNITEQLNFKIPLETAAQVLEQIMLLLLIIGRWIMPKSQRISREKLSEILLMYIGIAADIIELFEVFKEESVRHRKSLTILVLIVWTISLLQFCFVLAEKTDDKPTMNTFVISNEYNVVNNSFTSISLMQISPNYIQQPIHKNCCFHILFIIRSKLVRYIKFSNDVYSILMSLLLQDTPFLIIRLYFMIKHRVISYTNTFFTAKNTLLIILMLYRLIAIEIEYLKKMRKEEKDFNQHLIDSKNNEYSRSMLDPNESIVENGSVVRRNNNANINELDDKQKEKTMEDIRKNIEILEDLIKEMNKSND